MKAFRQALKSGGFFVLFCLLLTVAVLGVKVPTPTPVISVGAMQFAPFADGLSLYQSFRGLYYPISPFNDYVINQDGRSSFITKDQLLTKSYTTTLTNNPLITIPQSISAYLWNNAPKISFTTNGETMQYTSSVHENQLIVMSKFTNQTPPDPQKMGITLAYHSDDIIFDRSKKVYNYWEAQDLTSMQKTYGLTLTPSQNELVIPVKDRHVYIYNPAINGVIEISANSNQQLLVNRDSKLIELVQPVTEHNGAYATSMHIRIWNNLQEVLK